MKKFLIFCLAILCVIKTVFAETQENPPIVEGKVFIIPHGSCYVNCGHKFTLIKMFGYDLNKCHIFVPVWLYSQESENWNAHGHPVLNEKNIRFPYHIPLKMLKNKKEGDIIEFLLYNKKNESVMVRLQLQQGQCRYRTCGKGKFEECLSKEMNVEEAKKQKKATMKDYKQMFGKNFKLIHPFELDEYGNPIRPGL